MTNNKALTSTLTQDIVFRMSINDYSGIVVGDIPTNASNNLGIRAYHETFEDRQQAQLRSLEISNPEKGLNQKQIRLGNYKTPDSLANTINSDSDNPSPLESKMPIQFFRDLQKLFPVVTPHHSVLKEIDPHRNLYSPLQNAIAEFDGKYHQNIQFEVTLDEAAYTNSRLTLVIAQYEYREDLFETIELLQEKYDNQFNVIGQRIFFTTDFGVPRESLGRS